jgi:hypothetical protein
MIFSPNGDRETVQVIYPREEGLAVATGVSRFVKAIELPQ